MAENDTSSDHIIAKLLDMGFELSKAIQAVESVGLSLDAAIGFILNSEQQEVTQGHLISDVCSSVNEAPFTKKMGLGGHSSHHSKLSSISNHSSSLHKPKIIRSLGLPKKFNPQPGSSNGGFWKGNDSSLSLPSSSNQETGTLNRVIVTDLHREKITNDILHKKFGVLSLKDFQKKTLDAWMCHRDCLVLAATGSGYHSIPLLMLTQISFVEILSVGAFQESLCASNFRHS